MKARLNLTRTSAALEAFDTVHEPHDSGHGSPLAKAVGEAFALDTADRNDPATARMVRPGPRVPRGGEADLSFVRRLVGTFRRAEEEKAK